MVLEEGYHHSLWLMSFQLPSPAFLCPHLMQKSLLHKLIQQKDCEHHRAHDTVTSAGTQKHIMAKRKTILRCFLGWLKLLMKPLGCPGIEGCTPWHLLYPQSTLAVSAQSHYGQAVALSPPESSGCQHTKVSMSKQQSKTKAFPEKTAKAIHRLLGCLFQQ